MAGKEGVWVMIQKEGANKDSVYFSVPLKSVGLNLLYMYMQANSITFLHWFFFKLEVNMKTQVKAFRSHTCFQMSVS